MITLNRTSPAGQVRPPESAPSATRFCVFNKTEESFLALSVVRCGTTLGRIRGLLGKLEVKSGEAIWFYRSQGFHTVGMLSPIDVIFLDAQQRVIHMIEHMRPFRISPGRLKNAGILALPAHTIYASQTCVGDELLICEPQELEVWLTRGSSVRSQGYPQITRSSE